MKETGKKITPRARKDGLLVQELPDEVLVYDLERHKAHCLNSSAAFIWKHCDGHTSIARLAQLLEKSLGTSVDEDVVWCALNQLDKDKLLEESLAWPLGTERISRRALVRRIGIAAILLPLVTTISAPLAQAASSCGMGCTGGIGGSCPSGCTCCPDGICRAVC